MLVVVECCLCEEMGIFVVLKYVGELFYWIEFDNGLIEYEYDYLYIGVFDEIFILNFDEVDVY